MATVMQHAVGSEPHAEQRLCVLLCRSFVSSFALCPPTWIVAKEAAGALASTSPRASGSIASPADADRQLRDAQRGHALQGNQRYGQGSQCARGSLHAFFVTKKRVCREVPPSPGAAGQERLAQALRSPTPPGEGRP